MTSTVAAGTIAITTTAVGKAVRRIPFVLTTGADASALASRRNQPSCFPRQDPQVNLQLTLQGFPMVLCPVAIAVGCKKCPIFKRCPVKGLIGDYKEPAGARARIAARKSSRDA